MTTQCVKVSELRKAGYTDLKHWLSDSNNIYVGRAGRIWIHGSEKEIFHYKSSKWANPFKVSQNCPLEASLKKYRQYLDDSGLINALEELRGYTMGCWCNSHKCHAVILANLLNEKVN